MVLPAITRRSDAVVDPIPILPLAKIVKTDVPEEDATLNGLTPAPPCTLKVKDEEVALTPETVPLSRKRPVESDEAEVHRARKPFVPPEREPEIPREEVATQRVEEPVVWRTIPNVPVALFVSVRLPMILKLVVVLFVEVTLVIVAVVE